MLARNVEVIEPQRSVGVSTDHPVARQRLARALLSFAAASLLAGCAVRDRVVLLPSADGRQSAVEVSRRDAPGQPLKLDQPYAVAELKGDRLESSTTDATQVKERYGRVLALQPQRPRVFTVRFESNGNQLTDDAQPVLDEMREALARTPAAEVIVIGHTDSVGTSESNDRLSLQRAEAVADILVAAGVPRSAIQTVGRGEREPAVPTAPQVAEARNRRVEIKLR